MTFTIELPFLRLVLLRVTLHDHHTPPEGPVESTTVARAADLADDMIDVFRSPFWRRRPPPR